MNLNDISSSKTIIIKVKGNRLNIDSTWLNEAMLKHSNTNQIGNRILWVFDPSSKLIDFASTNLIGSVLAPNANIKFSGYSAVNGTLIANSLDGNNTSSELHYLGYFKGQIPEAPEAPEAPEVPEVPEASEAPEVPEVPEIPETPKKPSALIKEEIKITGRLPQTNGENQKQKQENKLPQTGEKEMLLSKGTTFLGWTILFLVGSYYIKLWKKKRE